MPPSAVSAGGVAAAGWSGLLHQISGVGSAALAGADGASAGAAGASAHSASAAAAVRKPSPSNGGKGERERAAARAPPRASVPAMCVRINSLVFAHSQLATLRGFVLAAWERLRIGDERDARTGERYAVTLLRASDSTLRIAAREVSMQMGTRVCFVDAREPFIEALHAQPPRGTGVRAGALGALLDAQLSPALETILALVAEGPTRTHALLGICCAAASAYERVLLDGGAQHGGAHSPRAQLRVRPRVRAA